MPNATINSLPMPDRLVLSAFRSNGMWPQINGPEITSMAAAAAELVAEGKMQWNDLPAMGHLTAGQLVEVGRILDGYHRRYEINAHVNPKGDKVHTSRIIPPERLNGLAQGWRKSIPQAERIFWRASYESDRDKRADPDLGEKKLHALSLMWQAAGARLAEPDMEEAATNYRDHLSELYQANGNWQERSIQQNRAVYRIARTAVMDSLSAINDMSGYTPGEHTVETWAGHVFAYGHDPVQSA